MAELAQHTAPTTITAVATSATYAYLSPGGCGGWLEMPVCTEGGATLLRGRVTSAGGPNVGRGVAGMTVSVHNTVAGNGQLGTSWPSRSGTTDAQGWFQIQFSNTFIDARSYAWTAVAHGNSTYAPSSTTGVLVYTVGDVPIPVRP